MKSLSVSDVVKCSDVFMRSVNLERDFAGNVVDDYIVTPHAKANFDRLISGLRVDDRQRAWRITSDYGSGKSSFALAFAKLFGPQRAPASLKGVVDLKALGVARAPHLLPVLVTGSRQPMSTAVLQSLNRTLSTVRQSGRRPAVVERVRKLAEEGGALRDDEVIRLVEGANAYVAEAGIAQGILVVLDELGKFLEFAALHPDRQDVLFLQNLAEVAARSGSTPLFVIGLLHQGFNAYAEQLSQGVQKEWEKVAGRYSEIFFALPAEQTASLISSALNVQTKKLPPEVTAMAGREMRRVVDLGCYGPSAGRNSLVDLAAHLYPLHPSVPPVLIRLFSRFGQNERSLFTFLFSEEPAGLREFMNRSLDGAGFYRIHNLYDYARAAFGSKLSVQSYRSHWNQLESVVESFPREHHDELNILKTVALLNLLDEPNLLASDDLLASSVAGKASKGAIERLREKHVLHYRGTAGGYCLWPHTSVNLHQAYADADNAVGTLRQVSTFLKEFLETRPVVARRHYVETGNLRHFRVEYVMPSAVDTGIDGVHQGADGLIVVPLCETEDERARALAFAKSATRKTPSVLVAVPKPLSALTGLVAEYERWKWISEKTPELRDDAYASEEVSRQLVAAREVLERRVRSFVGLKQFTEAMELEWIHLGEPVSIGSARELLSKLSKICDDVYPRAPRVKNELVNRRELSSAAAAARMRLIERVLKFADQPFLGMDRSKRPPEMSMYLSVLKRAGVHQEVGGRWTLVEPTLKNDPCNLRHSFAAMLALLEDAKEARIGVPALLKQIERPPFGVRDGLGVLLFAVFVALHEQNLAFYEDGAFVRHLGPEEFLRLTKQPASFEVQFCRVAGVRSAIFEQLLALLETQPVSQKPDILDVVRPLCQFAAQLPQYTHRTKSLSKPAAAIREVLLHAREPALLLFSDLPMALSLDPFDSNAESDPKRVRDFVRLLRAALDELKGAYPSLLSGLEAEFLSAVQRPGALADVRAQVAQAATQMLVGVADIRMKGFLMRLADTALASDAWIESVGSYVCARPPAKWSDGDVESFRTELRSIGAHYRRLEAMLYGGVVREKDSTAIRVAVTSTDGSEQDRVLWLSGIEEGEASEVESEVAKLLVGRARVGAVGVSRALGKALAAITAKDERRPGGR